MLGMNVHTYCSGCVFVSITSISNYADEFMRAHQTLHTGLVDPPSAVNSCLCSKCGLRECCIRLLVSWRPVINK